MNQEMNRNQFLPRSFATISLVFLGLFGLIAWLIQGASPTHANANANETAFLQLLKKRTPTPVPCRFCGLGTVTIGVVNPNGEPDPNAEAILDVDVIQLGGDIRQFTFEAVPLPALANKLQLPALTSSIRALKVAPKIVAMRFSVYQVNAAGKRMLIYTHTDKRAPYCAFAESGGKCTTMPSANGVLSWPTSDGKRGNGRVVESGQYQMDVRTLLSAKVDTPTTQRLTFEIQ